MKRMLVAALILLCTCVSPADAAVDLVSLPGRSYLQLTVYNSEDLTLVRERRLLTFKKGLNNIMKIFNSIHRILFYICKGSIKRNDAMSFTGMDYVCHCSYHLCYMYFVSGIYLKHLTFVNLIFLHH